jgi:hypothetical protein
MRPLVAIVAMALAGCAGPSVWGFHASTQYSTGHVRFAAMDGPTHAVIRANPFAGDRDHGGVLATMQRRNMEFPLEFSLTLKADATYGYKVVVLFATLVDPSANLCAAGEPASSAAPAGRIAVTAAFCARDFTLTQVSGSGPMPASPQDPAFRALMGDLLIALLPPFDPFRRDDRNGFRRNCPPNNPSC